MGELSGYGGGAKFYGSDATNYISISDATNNIYSWSLEVNCDTLDVTSFADGGERCFIRGLRGWTATAEAYVDDTNVICPSDAGSVARLWLYTKSDTVFYRGDALLTGVTPAAAVDGVVTQTLSWQGTSDLMFSDVS